MKLITRHSRLGTISACWPTSVLLSAFRHFISFCLPDLTTTLSFIRSGVFDRQLLVGLKILGGATIWHHSRAPFPLGYQTSVLLIHFSISYLSVEQILMKTMSLACSSSAARQTSS